MIDDKDLVRVSVYDNKYTIYQDHTGHVWADRYDQKKWLDVTNTPGSNMMLQMAYEIFFLRQKVEVLREIIADIQ